MKTRAWSRKGRGRVRKDEFENEDYDDYDDAEADRMEADDINIDEYLSSDDTPIIKHKLIITVTMMKITIRP
jgi:hypothetical protein